MSYTLEALYRVYDDVEGVCIGIRPHPDLPDALVELHTRSTPACKEFYGEVSLSLTSVQARLTAEALIRSADKIDGVIPGEKH